MSRFPGVRRLFHFALSPRAVQGDVDDELRFHLERRTADLVAGGLSPADARARAEREFGDVSSARRELAAMDQRRLARARRTESWSTFVQDARFALRALRRRPGFASVVLLTLALGIGANTAIFSVVHAVLLRPLPFARPDRIVHLWEGKVGSTQRLSEASYPDFLDWREQSTVFSSLEGYQGTGAIISGRSQPIFARGGRVTAGFFKLLGVSPQLGRDFVAGEDAPGSDRVTILGHGLWMRALEGDPHVVGTTIVLNGAPYTVIGVLPPSFIFPLDGQAELWIPIDASIRQRQSRGIHWLKTIGRLRDGVTMEQANANLSAIMRRMEAAYPATNTGRGIQLVPLRDEIVGSVRPLLLILYGTVGLLLLIACANVANLLLARGVARQKELAIRAALGAGRGRLVRQMLTESALLAFVGAALGVLVARAGVAALIAGIPDAQRRRMPELDGLPVDLTTLGYVVALTLAVAIGFGLLPALRASRPRLQDTIKQGTRGSGASVRPRLRDSLVVFELALTCVLLCGAGLLGRSLVRLLAEDAGFRADRVFTAGVRMSAPQATVPAQRAFFAELLRRARALPGVESVGLTTKLPLDYGNSSAFVVEGHPAPAAGQEPEASIRTVGGDYFGTLGIRLLRGRVFSDNDVEGMPRVVVINHALAEHVFPGEEPVGKRVTFGVGNGASTWTIAGVVADVPIDRLGERPRNTLYFSYLQDTDVDFFRVTMRTTADPVSAAAELRRIVRDLDPEVPLVQPTSMTQLVTESPSVFMRRYPLMLVGAFALSALVLALVGLFGVVSYSVAQRTQELGVRVALGAQRRDILSLVLRRGTGLAAIGVVLGLVGATWLTRFLSSLLYGVDPLDSVTFGSVALLLGVLAVLATLGPARRATRVDPMTALRSE